MSEIKATEPIRVDRPLTEDEYELPRWILEHGTPEASQFLEQLDRDRVVALCPCGCASINFEIEGLGKAPPDVRILGDSIFGGESDLSGIFVFESGGVLSGLEVFGYAGDAPKSLPNPSDRRQISGNA